ncbi:Hypothetical predicted protein [Mytilus galloprovincialis]|uniref:Uncharacterized protein n=1 Tax=Mytilus galloprovincialis TaxID=29158 RepID=A0A8B6GQK6_MYTGA|nr:Hypothetical predicted protein [Mytilus galloprovincialis]
MEQLERDKMERERDKEERRRLMEEIRLEQQELQRRAQKRTFDSRGGGRDEYWSEPKRAATNENRFDDNRSFGTTERKVERYDRRAEQPRGTDSREARRFDDRREFNREERSDRRNDDRFDRFDRGSGDQASFDRAARERNDRPVLREDRREGEFHRRSRSRDRSDTRVSRGRDEHRNERSHHTSPPRHTDNRDWKNERDNRTQADTRLVVSRQNIGGTVSSGGRDSWQNNNIQDDRSRNKGFINQQQGVATQQGRSWGGASTMDRQNIIDNRPTIQQERFTAVQQEARGTFANTINPALVGNVQPSIFVPAVPNTAQMIISNQGLAAARQQEARFDAYKSIQSGGFRRY